ncbi:MAG: hypothetical protein ACOCVG_04635, partial [Verrucomicrobiota bacterium]
AVSTANLFVNQFNGTLQFSINFVSKIIADANPFGSSGLCVINSFASRPLRIGSQDPKLSCLIDDAG